MRTAMFSLVRVLPAADNNPFRFLFKLLMPSALTGALLALLGGAAALIGQIVVQRLVHAFNRAKDRDAVLREKGEALVTTLMEYSEWCGYGMSTGKQGTNPLGKARALQRLYFPSLDEPMDELNRVHRFIMGADDRITSSEDPEMNQTLDCWHRGYPGLFD